MSEVRKNRDCTVNVVGGRAEYTRTCVATVFSENNIVHRFTSSIPSYTSLIFIPYLAKYFSHALQYTFIDLHAVNVRDIRPSASESQEMLVSRVAVIPRRERCHLRRLQVSIFRSARKCCGNSAGKGVTRNFFLTVEKIPGKNARFYILLNIIVVIEKCVSAGDVTRRGRHAFRFREFA